MESWTPSAAGAGNLQCTGPATRWQHHRHVAQLWQLSGGGGERVGKEETPPHLRELAEQNAPMN